MSPLFYAAIILLVGGGHLCGVCSGGMGRASVVFWWVGMILAIFGLILFLVAVIVTIAGPVQGIIGAHPSP